MKILLSICFLLISLPVFCDDEAKFDSEIILTPIYVLAPHIQVGFLPSPFSEKNLIWNTESARNVVKDPKEGLMLVLKGKLIDASFYLDSYKIPLEEGNFQYHLPVSEDSSSFIFTLDNKNGDRSVYKLTYFWSRNQSRSNKKKEFAVREWIFFKWETAESPIPQETFFLTLRKRSTFIAFDLAGTYNIQSGGAGEVSSLHFAYSPFFDFNAFGARLELGFSPLKYSNGSLFVSLNYQLFGRYTFLEKNTAELGVGGITLTGPSGGTKAILSILGRRQFDFLPFQQSLFAGYSLALFEPVINQFEIGLGFVF